VAALAILTELVLGGVARVVAPRTTSGRGHWVAVRQRAR
jgi:hypothetical protein